MKRQPKWGYVDKYLLHDNWTPTDKRILSARDEIG